MELAEENLATAEVDNNSWQQLWWIFWMFCVERRAKTVMSMCRAQTLNCGSNFTNCQDYVGVIGISEEDVIFFTWQLLDISTFQTKTKKEQSMANSKYRQYLSTSTQFWLKFECWILKCLRVLLAVGCNVILCCRLVGCWWLYTLHDNLCVLTINCRRSKEEFPYQKLLNQIIF